MAVEGTGLALGQVTSTWPTEQFRFFDNRQKYLQFVNTCNEKAKIAVRVAQASRHVMPSTPALALFDAGMGEATVLTGVLRRLHARLPTEPFLVVGKEISHEDVRIALEKMADRFFEHPQMVLVMTNMRYSEAPSLFPGGRSARATLNWNELKLTGNTTFDFEEQIQELEPNLSQWWRTRPSEKTGNPVYVEPSVLVIYRQDHATALSAVIPQKGQHHREYDVIIASQPYRLRQPAAVKVKQVLAPLAKSLAPGGCMVVVQSTGKDPGMEIVRKIWPDENPFQTPRQKLLRELNSQLGDEHPDLNFLSYPDSQAEFRYQLRVGDQEVDSVIGTSTLLAAWNAATYVAQIEDHRLLQAMRHGAYLDVVTDVLHKHKGLWFTDESFIVARQ